MALTQYALKVISPAEMEDLHRATLKILAETGVVFECDEALELFKHHGAKVEGRTVFISEALADKALISCPDTFFHRARNPKHSVLVGHQQKKKVISSSYGPVNILDPETGIRPGTLKDYKQLLQLSQALEPVTMVGGLPVEPSDAHPRKKYFQMLHSILRHGDKPIWTFSSPRENIFKIFEMIKIAFGEDDRLFDTPVTAAPVCPLSPLKYDKNAAETILAHARFRQPLYINSCILAGVSGPISLLGTATLMNTEILAGMILAQLAGPGTPVVYVPGATVADMKSGAYVCGSPESNLIVTAGLQMALDRYRLPTRVMGGLSDARGLDYQCGAETMQNMFVPLMAGAHYLNNALGNMDGQMTTSLEKFVLDAESFARVLRVLDGFTEADRDLSLDLIQQEAHQGNYLMNPSTFGRFKDRWRPEVTPWQSREHWENQGSPDAGEQARIRCREILAAAPESLLDRETDQALASFVDQVEPI